MSGKIIHAGVTHTYRKHDNGDSENLVTRSTKCSQLRDISNYQHHFGRKANLAVWGLSWQEIIAMGNLP